MKNKQSLKSEIGEMMVCFEFLEQFSPAEQAQLMEWIETLVSEGEVRVDGDHPLFNAFDGLAKYIGHQSDQLPIREQ
jgi:hypothetical protein